jgi:hypothetical protein
MRYTPVDCFETHPFRVAVGCPRLIRTARREPWNAAQPDAPADTTR